MFMQVMASEQGAPHASLPFNVGSYVLIQLDSTKDKLIAYYPILHNSTGIIMKRKYLCNQHRIYLVQTASECHWFNECDLKHLIN